MSGPHGTHTRTVGFVLSTNFAGSTLLGLLLGERTSAAFVGEPALVHRRDDDGSYRHRRFCARCRQHDERCPLWSPESVGRLRALPVDAYLELAGIADAPVVVDTSKEIDWVEQLVATEAVDARLVHLTKSLEAFAVSLLGHEGTERDLGWLAAYWSHRNRSVLAYADRSGLPYLHVRYDDLVRSPDHAVGAVAAFLGLEVVAEPDDRLDGHYVKGNPRVRAAASTESAIEVVPDERWRELAAAQLDDLYAAPSVRSLARDLGEGPPSGAGAGPLRAVIAEAKVLARRGVGRLDR